MLNKLEKRLKNTKLESIKLSDLVKIVDVMGIFDVDAVVQDDRRYSIKRIRAEAADCAVVLELGDVEYPDKDGKLVREFTELTIDGTAIEVNETTGDVDIPVNKCMKSIITDFLANKDKYTDVYQKLQRIREIQEQIYMAEVNRLSIHNGLVDRLSERGGLFD